MQSLCALSMILAVCFFQSDSHTRSCNTSHFYPSPQLDSAHGEQGLCLIQCITSAPSSQQELTKYWMKKAHINRQIKSILPYGCTPRPLRFWQTPDTCFSVTFYLEEIKADVLDTIWQSQASVPIRKTTPENVLAETLSQRERDTAICEEQFLWLYL